MSKPRAKDGGTRSDSKTKTKVHKGEVVFRIDDGDYRIAVDGATARIATQEATVDRLGRQVTALVRPDLGPVTVSMSFT